MSKDDKNKTKADKKEDKKEDKKADKYQALMDQIYKPEETEKWKTVNVDSALEALGGKEEVYKLLDSEIKEINTAGIQSAVVNSGYFFSKPFKKVAEKSYGENRENETYLFNILPDDKKVELLKKASKNYNVEIMIHIANDENFIQSLSKNQIKDVMDTFDNFDENERGIRILAYHGMFDKLDGEDLNKYADKLSNGTAKTMISRLDTQKKYQMLNFAMISGIENKKSKHLYNEKYVEKLFSFGIAKEFDGKQIHALLTDNNISGKSFLMKPEFLGKLNDKEFSDLKERFKNNNAFNVEDKRRIEVEEKKAAEEEKRLAAEEAKKLEAAEKKRVEDFKALAKKLAEEAAERKAAEEAKRRALVEKTKNFMTEKLILPVKILRQQKDLPMKKLKQKKKDLNLKKLKRKGWMMQRRKELMY